MDIYANTPYTYRIGWSDTGMNYYGVRYAKDCHPDELFVTYFTSSAYVAEYIKEHGLPDIIEVRQTFISEDRVSKSLEYEHRVLKRLKVTTRDDYLNKAVGKCLMATMDKEVKEKQHKNLKKSLNTPEYKLKRSQIASEINARPEIKASQVNAWTKENNPNYDDAIYSFVNIVTGTRERCTTYDLSKKYPGIDARCLVKKNRTANSTGDWMLEGSTPTTFAGKNNPRYDHTTYHFVHISGVEEFATLFDFAKKHNLGRGPLNFLKSGKWSQYKGWRLKT